jgi:hypothetical protein
MVPRENGHIRRLKGVFVMKIREYEFDGTADEFVKVAQVLRGTTTKHTETDGQPHSEPTEHSSPSAANGSNKRFVTCEQARKILTRRKLSTPLDRFMEHVYRAGDQKVKSNELREVLGFDDAADQSGADRFRGMLGAFGRRVVHDVGTEVDFFDANWNVDAGQMEYRLPPSVRQAMDELGWYR